MIDNCKLVYVDGVATAFDDRGEKSSLFQEALAYTEGNQEEAVKIWAATQTQEFDLEVGEESPNLETVLRFLNNRVAEPKTLSTEDLKEVSLMMADLGVNSIEEFTEKMNDMFQPKGYYEVDSKKLLKSGMYSVDDINTLDHVAVKSFLEKLNYYNEHKTYNLESAPKKAKIQLRNTTSKKNPFGAYPLVSEQELVEYIIDNSEDLSESSILKTIGESPFSQVLDDKKAMKAIMSILSGKTKVSKLFFDGEKFTSENIDTFVTLRNTLLADADPIELEADLEFIEGISETVWLVKQKEVKAVLKEIEKTAMKYNIDIIGISDLSMDREGVLGILSALDDMLLAPSVENIKRFAQRKDEKIKPNKPYTVVQLKEKYRDYNIVKIDTTLSDEAMLQSGLVRIGSNGLYHRVQRASTEDMYGVVYDKVMDNSLIIPSTFFPKGLNIKDPQNLETVMEGIQNYINSRGVSEEMSLLQTIFEHDKIETFTPQEIETDEEYLKTKFVSDFYNYILEQKQQKSDLYNKVLKYFSITDSDIVLDSLETPDISNIKYEKELRDYARLKKFGQIKQLEKDSKTNQDLEVLNDPKKVKEDSGTTYVMSNDGYVLTEPNPNIYFKTGGKLYRKVLDKSNGALYKEVQLTNNAIYFDNNLNFSHSREEAESAHKKLSKSLRKTPLKTGKEIYEMVNLSDKITPIQYQIIGEQGARNLDQVEEATFRMDNLIIAKEMMQAGKTPLEIRLATGWELGADSKWKYEILDGGIKDVKLTFNHKHKFFKEPVAKLKLTDLVDNNELFTAYPQLRDINVYVYETKDEILANNKMFVMDNEIFLNKEDYDNKRGGLKFSDGERGDVLHEVQHLLQGYEGFSKGGSRGWARQRVAETIVRVREKGLERTIEDGYKSEIDRIIVEHLKTTPLKDVLSELLNKESSVEPISIAKAIEYEIYLQLAGEVESRNVQARLNMTAEQRRQTLLQETEDVAREDQIFLRNNAQYQIIGEQGASRMIEYKQQLDRAKELEKEGKTPAQIELETGWYKYKGDWRTIPKEVVDSFQIKDRTVNKELTLKQVLGDDSTIFSFYPEISGAKVVFLGDNYKNNTFKETETQALGFVNEKDGIIYINTSITNPFTGVRENVDGFNQLKTLEQGVKSLIQNIAQKDSKETVEEIITQLKKTGLVQEVIQLNTTQLQDKLKEFEGETKQFIIDGNDTQIGKKAFLKTSVKPLLQEEIETNLEDVINIEEFTKITPNISYKNAKIKFKRYDNRASEISAELQLSGSKVGSITIYFGESDLQSSEDRLRREVALLISHETQHIYDRGNSRNSGTNLTRVSETRQKSFGDVSTRVKKTFDGRGVEIFSENFGVDFGLYLAYEGEYRARLNALQEQGIQEELFEVFEPKIEKEYLWNSEKDFINNDPQYYYDLAVNWYANTVNPAKSGIEFMKNERGLVKGFVVNNQVYLNTDLMDETTPIHEFQHLFLNWSKEARPDIYNRGLELARKELEKGENSEIKDVISYVRTTQPNLTGEALENEVITEFIGRYSKQMMDEQKAKSPLMQWLSDFWNEIRKMLGINEMTPAQVANLTLEEYAKASVVTLSKGENFVGENGEANFNRWKGENELVAGSEIQNVKTGQSIVAKAYHGTTNEFYEFDASVKGSIEGHLGKVNYFTSDYQDATQNYLSDGADITGRIDRRQDELEDTLRYDYQSSEEGLDFQNIIEDFNITDEEVENLYPSGKPEFIQAEEISRFLAEKEIKGGTEQILDVFIKLNNPVVLGNGATWFEALDIDEVYIQEATEEIAEEYGITEDEAKEEYEYEIRDRAIEKQGDGNKIISALEQALDNNGYDQAQAFDILGDNYYESEVDLESLEQSIRRAELYDNYEGELASSQVIADFFKNLGFDGIILTDVAERFKGMRLSPSTSHIHVFDEFNTQIKLADGSNTTFNPKTPDIRYQKIVYDKRAENRVNTFQLVNDFGFTIKNIYPKSQEQEIRDKFDECRI